MADDPKLKIAFSSDLKQVLSEEISRLREGISKPQESNAVARLVGGILAISKLELAVAASEATPRPLNLRLGNGTSSKKDSPTAQ